MPHLYGYGNTSGSSKYTTELITHELGNARVEHRQGPALVRVGQGRPDHTPCTAFALALPLPVPNARANEFDRAQSLC